METTKLIEALSTSPILVNSIERGGIQGHKNFICGGGLIIDGKAYGYRAYAIFDGENPDYSKHLGNTIECEFGVFTITS